MQSERHTSTTSRHRLRLTDTKWKRVLLFFEITDVLCRLTSKTTVQNATFKSWNLSLGYLVLMAWISFFCEGTINAKSYIEVLDKHLLPSRLSLFKQLISFYFHLLFYLFQCTYCLGFYLSLVISFSYFHLCSH